MAKQGWLGDRSQLLHTLGVFGADKDDNGDYLLYNEPVTFGLGGEDAVVHQNTECTIDGKRANVAHLMHQTSYGVKVIVM